MLLFLVNYILIESYVGILKANEKSWRDILVKKKGENKFSLRVLSMTQLMKTPIKWSSAPVFFFTSLSY